MRVLIDCMPLTVGGGVQVAIALMENLYDCPDVAWQAVVPRALKTWLPEHLASDTRLIFERKTGHLDRIWLGRRLATLEAIFKPDVVFSVFGPAYFNAKAPHLVGFALPNLIYDRDSDVASSNKILEPVLDWMRCSSFKKADHLVVETKTVKTRLVARLGISESKVSVVANSVNPLLAAAIGDAPSSDGSDKANPFVVLVPSAFYKHKNLEVIPVVAAEIERAYPKFEFEFHLTLQPNSPAWKMLALKANSLGVGPRLKTLGALPITKLGQAYRASSAVYLPTLREASTAVYPESFYFNRPLVTSDMDFARELCGDAAIFVPPKDATATAQALIALASDPERAARLVATAQDHLQMTYPTNDVKFKQQLALLRAVADSPRGKTFRRPEKLSSWFGQPQGRDTQSNIFNDAIGFHDQIALHWDSKYKVGGFRRRADFIEKRVLPSSAGGERWLDAGCGTGYFSRSLAYRGANVVGVDAAPEMIRAACALAQQSSLNHLEFRIINSIQCLPYADASFDGVICLSVLEYVIDPAECLAEIARVLVPGGALILSVPNRHSLVRAIQRIANKLAKYSPLSRFEYESLSRFLTTKNELRNLLNGQSLRVNKMVSFDAITPPQLWSVLPGSLIFVVATKVMPSQTKL